MSKSKRIDLICGVGAVVMVLLTILYLCFGGTFLTASAAEMPYVGKLFSTDRVHEIDLVADEDDWEAMLENAASEEYISCTAVIDGEKYANVGIRPKGNSSLRTVAGSDSDRYSFKLEFDRYDQNSTYHGLDKLCLNNAIQDNTYMKDFLCYQMMNALGADAPLSSFVWITVNGEDWGLYTAVEGIEDAFAQREYGTAHGQIYKPDSMDMGGGGRGAEARNPADGQSQEAVQAGAKPAEKGFGRMGGRNGSEDVLLVYSDDDPESYPNIFDNAVFDGVTEQDRERLVQSLKALNEGDVESSVNVNEVLRYFAVHNFVLNDDSYTGSIIHNYYLYEDGGLLSMIAWDYNLAFGGMGMGGMGTEAATDTVNAPIDSPVSDGDISERPMVSWIFGNEEYTEQYHQVMDEFISGFFESGQFETIIDGAIDMIAPYVEKDPTAFCTYEEFQTGAETLKEFCLLRAQSVRGQLNGTIPSTSEGQNEDSSGFVDASHLTLSAMGSQGDGMGMKQGFGFGRNKAPEAAEESGETMPSMNEEQKAAGNEIPQPGERDGTTHPDLQGGEPPQGMDGGFPGGMGQEAPSEESAGADPVETRLLLGGSCILLLAGLLFAKFYR